MAQPSSLQVLGGPLGGQRFEFSGGDVFVGSAPECAVSIDAPGVEAHHARIVIDITGATIYRVDGAVGVNDDAVADEALLRSGDFVWIGEPAGPTSIMLQFTLGDVDETPVAAPAPDPVRTIEPESEALVEEIVSEDLAAPQEVVEEVLVEEAPAEPLPPPPAEAEMVEMAPEPMPAEPEPAVIEPAPVEEMLMEEPAAEIEHVSEVEHAFEAPAAEEPFPAPVEAKVVPPAPWQMPAAPTVEAAPQAEYASAWESAPPAPEPPAPADAAEATMLLPATKPSSGVESPAAKPASPAPVKRAPAPSSPKLKIRTVEQDAALRTPPPPPPPARTTSSTPMVVGGLVFLMIFGVVAYFLSRPAAAPAPPPPTPTPVVAATPETTPEATPEATQVAAAEPTPEPPPVAPPVATPLAPTPRAATTPPPRATPTPRATPPPRATPTPAPTRPGATAPVVAPPVTAAPAAPVSQAPRLLDEARAAMAAKDLPRASQLLDQVLRIEPGNGEATRSKAEVDARMVLLGRRFSVGATTVIGGKTAGKGPTGFDLGGGGVVRTDFSAQVRCTTTPTSVEGNTQFTIRCSILNIGTKPFKLESVTVNETQDGAKTTAAGTTPRADIAPQADAVILEKSGTWASRSQWSLEIVAKTTKDESFRAVYNWR